jgi:hypothetical protein
MMRSGARRPHLIGDDALGTGRDGAFQHHQAFEVATGFGQGLRRKGPERAQVQPFQAAAFGMDLARIGEGAENRAQGEHAGLGVLRAFAAQQPTRMAARARGLFFIHLGNEPQRGNQGAMVQFTHFRVVVG